MSELKLETFQKVEHLLCLFHYKQAINHITTIKEERTEIFNILLLLEFYHKFVDKY